MKILIVIPYFYPSIGGLQNYALSIIQGLEHDYGVEVVVVTTNHQTNTYDQIQVGKIRVYRLPALCKLSNTPINPFWLISIQNIIAKEKPDIINGHTPVPFIADVAGILAFCNRIPFVLTYQNDLVKESRVLSYLFNIYYMTVGICIFRIAKRIITSSEYYAQKSPYLQKYKEKVSVVSPGVDPKRFAQVKKPPFILPKKYFLFVGQLTKTHIHKGVNYMLSALARTRKIIPNIELVVVGTGDNMDEYKKLAMELSIEKQVHFPGKVDDTDLPVYYQHAIAVILPTINDSEGFGMVLIEAGICKKPVIGTAVGGIPFVIEQGKTGILIPPKDSIALSKAMESIYMHPREAKKMGEQGYEKVMQTFIWQAQVEKTYKIFSQVKKLFVEKEG